MISFFLSFKDIFQNIKKRGGYEKNEKKPTYSQIQIFKKQARNSRDCCVLKSNRTEKNADCNRCPMLTTIVMCVFYLLKIS